MSASPISQTILRLLEKMSQLTAEEVCEVDHFIEFLLTKKGRTLHHVDMMQDPQDASHTDTISEFIASFTGSPIPQPHTSQKSSDSSPHFSSPFSRKEKEQNKANMVEQAFDGESSRVIIAPEEGVLEDHPNDIDFADINARFSKKREGQHGGKSKESKRDDLDWL